MISYSFNLAYQALSGFLKNLDPSCLLLESIDIVDFPSESEGICNKVYHCLMCMYNSVNAKNVNFANEPGQIRYWCRNIFTHVAHFT